MDNNENVTIENNPLDETSLSLKEVLFIVKKNIIAILIIIFVSIGLGIAYTVTKKPSYKSTGTMLVSYDKFEDISVSTGYSFSKYVSDTFAVFITEDVVIDKVATKVNVPSSKIKSHLSVSNDSLIITVSYTSSSALEAQEIVDCVIDTAKEVANEKKEDGSSRYPLLYNNLVDLSAAKKGTKISTTFRDIAIAFGIGFVVSIIYVSLKELLNNRFKSIEDVERTLNIPVLAGIPDYELDNEKDGGK